MTEPDDGLGEALRRTLSAAASEVEPGTDGLDRIRARIGQRPPRPWLLSVLLLGFDRVRYWTWRGHWAWPDALPRLGRPDPPGGAAASTVFRSLPRHGSQPAPGVRWLRPVAVLGGIVVVAGISLGVQPFRHAIIAASSTVLNGGSGSQTSAAGTDGNGTRTTDHGGLPPSGGPAGSGPGPVYSPGGTGTAAPGSAAIAPGGKCNNSPPGAATTTDGPGSSTPGVNSTATLAPVTSAPSTSPTVTATPDATASAQPDASSSTAWTCPVTGSPSASSTASPTPTSSATPTGSATTATPTSSPVASGEVSPAPSDTWPYVTPTPTDTSTGPTDTSSDPDGDGGGDSPSPSPTPSPTPTDSSPAPTSSDPASPPPGSGWGGGHWRPPQQP